MNRILKNAQEEFEIFKRTEMHHSKEIIFYHAQRIATYEYLLYLIEHYNWDLYKEKSPQLYYSLASNTSLLDFFYDTIVSDGFHIFNYNLLEELLQFN